MSETDIARLTRERDEAREALADAGTLMGRTIAMSYCTSAEMPEKDHTHALPSAMLRVIRERDEAREALAEFLNEPCKDCLGYEARMSGMEDAYRDSERGRRDAEAEAKRMRQAAAENFADAVAAQEAALAAEARAAAAEKERDDARERAESLSRELLAAIQARDSYRASAELRVGMRREFEELLGVSDTTGEEAFARGLARLRALRAAEAKAERLAKAAKKRLAEIPHHDEGSCRRIDCGDCALRAALAEVGE